MTEVERRAAFDTATFTRVFDKLDREQIPWAYTTRVMIDVSKELAGRKQTVMIRVQRAKDETVHAELAAKSGGAGDARRAEAMVPFSPDDLIEMLKALAIMGYTTASVGVRNLCNAQIGNIEYSFRKVIGLQNDAKDFGYVLEVESKDSSVAVADLDDSLAKLDLQPLSTKESVALFASFHSQANLDVNNVYASAEDLSVLVASVLSDAAKSTGLSPNF